MTFPEISDAVEDFRRRLEKGGVKTFSTFGMSIFPQYVTNGTLSKRMRIDFEIEIGNQIEQLTISERIRSTRSQLAQLQQSPETTRVEHVLISILNQMNRTLEDLDRETLKQAER